MALRILGSTLTRGVSQVLRTPRHVAAASAGAVRFPHLLAPASASIRTMSNKAFVRKPAPDFVGTAVVNGEFKDIKLSDYKGKYLVLFFYPLDFTFVCPTEITAFSDKAADFRALNCEVVAASTDSHFTHFAWAQTPRKEGGLAPMNIPLLADNKQTISKDYGVYVEEDGHDLRGLFIIDDKGVIRHITLNDYPVGRSVDEALRLVKAFQFTDKHGEVCPAGWQPGSATIKDDPIKKLEYFSKVN